MAGVRQAGTCATSSLVPWSPRRQALLLAVLRTSRTQLVEVRNAAPNPDAGPGADGPPSPVESASQARPSVDADAASGLTVTPGVSSRPAPPFHRIGRREGNVLIGGVPALTLAATYGTPLYVIDALELDSQIERACAALPTPRFLLYYSVKANPGLRVLRTALKRGLGLDLCSPGDLFLADKAGAPASALSWTGVGLSDERMQDLCSRGVWVNLDSESQADRWARTCRAPVGLRVAVEIDAGFHPHCRSGRWGGKFGIAVDRVVATAAHLNDSGSPVEVLHTHLGSSIGDQRPYLSAFSTLLDLAGTMPSVRCINLGGGLGEPFHPDDAPFPLAALRDGLDAMSDAFEARTTRRLQVALEPGEFVASSAGYLITRVLDVKRWTRGAEHAIAAIVDSGANDYPANSLYDSYLHLYVDGKLDVEPLETCTVYGITNQSGDTLARDRALPALERGDLLVVRSAGTYAWCRSTQFNERPRPAEVWVTDGGHELARSAETMEDLIRGQR